ncbi:glycosyltransferase family 2 protein [uncultured Umboniibacter sp.]|uniref:glycosyltransferase family 2 protein n=1 Tax=uncultured Umboniibacter sp. TaxID=1798917 RepID=UPI0026065B3E|nr:glycosyltransferase family 2 protein [uncultured Umboniibacter sp.]
MKLAVLIPYYNHPNAIESVVTKLRTSDLPVLIVNDGSNSDSDAVLGRLGSLDSVQVFHREENGGKGAAVVSGLRWAEQLGFSHVVQVDADGQHGLEALPQLLRSATEAPEDLIAGLPQFDASIPKRRLYGRYVTHILVWLNSLSFTIKDSMCGFRVYPLVSTLQAVDQGEMHWRMGFDIEILVRLHWQGVRMQWVPVNVSYPEDGVSHFRALHDNLEIASTHWKLFLGMLIRSPKLVYRWFK